MASFRTDEQKLEFLSARINRRPDPPFIPLSLIPYIYYILYYILIDRVTVAPPKGGLTLILKRIISIIRGFSKKTHES